jgi:hypothetical protein
MLLILFDKINCSIILLMTFFELNVKYRIVEEWTQTRSDHEYHAHTKRK